LTTSAAWKLEWSKPAFRYQSFFCVAVLLMFATCIGYFFDFIESRQGDLLNDPILERIPSHDVSWLIFFILYLSLFMGLSTNRSKPRLILLAFQTYCLVTLMRVLSIYLLPLEPPNGYIPLREPFVSLFTDDGKIISKDLFFSGHVSTIMSLFLTVRQRLIRSILSVFVFVLCMLLLVQHVHYTIDLLVSVPATWLCYLFSKRILQKKFLEQKSIV